MCAKLRISKLCQPGAADGLDAVRLSLGKPCFGVSLVNLQSCLLLHLIGEQAYQIEAPRPFGRARISNRGIQPAVGSGHLQWRSASGATGKLFAPRRVRYDPHAQRRVELPDTVESEVACSISMIRTPNDRAGSWLQVRQSLHSCHRKSELKTYIGFYNVYFLPISI